MTHALVIAGMGPGSEETVSPELLSLARSSARVFVRTEKHPSISLLKSYGVGYISFDQDYEKAQDFDSLYEKISRTVLESAEKNDTLYVVPGTPLIGEKSVEIILSKARAQGLSNIKIVPGRGFVDAVLAAVPIAAPRGYILLDAYDIYEGKLPDVFPFGLPIIVFQVHDKFMASLTKLWLLEVLPSDYDVFMVTAASVPGQEEVLKIPLEELDRAGAPNHLTSVVVPAFASEGEKTSGREGLFIRFLSIIARLRSDEGCPWDRKQTYESLTKFLLEETYEVVLAVQAKDEMKVREELGDLLLELGLYCQIASEKGKFSFSDVIAGINEKLIRRHPHVFGREVLNTPEEVEKRWEEIKRQEPGRYEKDHSLMDEVEKGLPALIQAQKQQVLASEVGFDWESAEGVFDKILEEMREVKEAFVAGDKDKVQEEIGDLLYASVNLSRFLNVDAESALIRAIGKFSRRFRKMENYLRSHDLSMKEMDLSSLDKLWERAKRLEDKSEVERKPED